MFTEHIYEDNARIVYETDIPVMFSLLEDGAFKKKWKEWKPRYFSLREDSTIVYRKQKEMAIKCKLNLRGTRIQQVSIDSGTNILIKKERGICCSCTKDGVETFFRCIMSESEMDKFFAAIRHTVENHHIEPFSTNLDKFSPVTALSNQSVMRQAISQAMEKYETRSTHDQILHRRGAMSWLPVFFFFGSGSWFLVVRSRQLAVCHFFCRHSGK